MGISSLCDEALWDTLCPSEMGGCFTALSLLKFRLEEQEEAPGPLRVVSWEQVEKHLP